MEGGSGESNGDILGEDQVEAHIMSILRKRGSLTTAEVEEESASMGRRCPDGAVRTLVRLRAQGTILGEISRARKGWVWSLPVAPETALEKGEYGGQDDC